MKQIVLSIEQMKHLEELGLDTSDASMFWHTHSNLTWLSLSNDRYHESEGWITNVTPAYTLQDILNVIEKDKKVRYVLSAMDIEIYLMGTATKIYTSFNGNSPLDYAYDALVWCIENGYIKKNKV